MIDTNDSSTVHTSRAPRRSTKPSVATPKRGRLAKGKKQADGVYELLAKKGELDAEKAERVRRCEIAGEVYASGQFADSASEL